MEGTEIVLTLVLWLMFTIWGSTINKNNGRNQMIGALVGMFLGIIGILILYGMGPTKEKKIEDFKKYQNLVNNHKTE
jgi:glycerol uptake facilitator-like aquaporin